MVEVTTLYYIQQSPAHQMDYVLSTVRIDLLVVTLTSHVPVEVTVCLISMGTVMIMKLGTAPPFHAKRTVPAVSTVVAEVHPATANAPLLASPAPQRVGTVV